MKGAYWDSEIKLAQVQGHADYPVFTRKAATDVSWLACARRMLECRDAIYPAFATHNAHSLAFVLECAGDGDFEMQRLHGMGEALYHDAAYPVRVYAPVGTHEDLLAYLVRRLLENGANTSFVHRLVDPSVPEEAIVADPGGASCARSAPAAIHAFLCRAISIRTASIRPGSILPIARLRRRCCRGPTSIAERTRDTAARGEIRSPADRRVLVGRDRRCRTGSRSTRRSTCSRAAGATGTRRAARIAPRCWSAPPI